MAESNYDFLRHCQVVEYEGHALPSEWNDLRNSVYINEKAFLNPDSLRKYDHLGVHIGLLDQEKNQIIGCIQTYLAEAGEFQERSTIPASHLTSGIVLTRLMIHNDYRGKNLGGALLYLAMQKGRQWGRERVFLYTEEGEQSTRKYVGYEPINLAPQFVPEGLQQQKVIANTQRLDLSITRCYSYLPEAVRDFIQPHLANEAINTVSRRLDQFFKNPWFAAIYEEKLSKSQYIQTLANLHQFVRLTTRILARAVSISQESAMRRHFLEHLNGEVDHEVQIESDLRHLGADVDYIKKHMIPSVPTQQFMVIQESLLAFNYDPLSYIAVPFSIEGFTARLDDHFIECLERCVEKWGIKRPSRAITFFKLHIQSDGGHDGHWEHNKEILAKFIIDENKLQKILNTIHLTMDSLEKCYASYVAEPDFESIFGLGARIEEVAVAHQQQLQ